MPTVILDISQTAKEIAKTHAKRERYFFHCAADRPIGRQDYSRKVHFKDSSQPNASKKSPLFELALVLVPLDHVARFIVNANHGIM
jgi:hypothetical protein